MKEIKITPLFTNKSFVLERYFSEVTRYQILSPEEEVELAKKVREGDKAAMDKLVRCNLRFVVSVAKKYQNLGVSLEDLISEGNMALIRAATKFDETKGFKFISFAVWLIRQNIISCLSEKRRMVRLPGNILLGYSRVSRASLELEQLLEREPCPSEIAEYMNMSEHKVIEFLNTSSYSVSLDQSLTEDSEQTMLDVIVDSDALSPEEWSINASLKLELERLLNKLNMREQLIIELSYGLNGGFPMSLEDIAETLKISSERVRQIKTGAMRTLKQIARPQLKGYL